MNNSAGKEQVRRGKIIYRTKGFYYAKTDDKEIHECHLKRRLFVKSVEKPDPVAGDVVYFTKKEIHSTPLIHEIEARKTVLRRKKTTRNEQLTIAANIELLLITAPLCQPEYNYAMTVKLIAEATAHKIQPVVVLTKSDLSPSPATQTHETHFKEFDIPVFITGQNDTNRNERPELKAFIKGKLCVLCGVSGAGKSSLLNMMFANLNIRTGDVKTRYNRGRHTTTLTVLHEPEDGFEIIDSPGIRNFEFCDIDKHTLRNHIPLIKDYNHLCKMRNCLHDSERKCAVKEGVDQSKISRRLYAGYLTILRSFNF